MPTRTAGEKAKIEKRIRAERIIMTAVGALALLAFLVLGIISSRKTGCFDLYPESTPEVTDDPLFASVNRLKSVFGGELTYGDGIYLLSFKSSADGCDTAVRIYKKSGIECIQIIRSLGVIRSTPEHTDIFGEDDRDDPDAVCSVADADRIAEEISECFGAILKSSDLSSFTQRIGSVLSEYDNGKTLKNSFLYESYIVKTELDCLNDLFTVVIEPA